MEFVKYQSVEKTINLKLNKIKGDVVFFHSVAQPNPWRFFIVGR